MLNINEEKNEEKINISNDSDSFYIIVGGIHNYPKIKTLFSQEKIFPHT